MRIQIQVFVKGLGPSADYDLFTVPDDLPAWTQDFIKATTGSGAGEVIIYINSTAMPGLVTLAIAPCLDGDPRSFDQLLEDERLLAISLDVPTMKQLRAALTAAIASEERSTA